MIDINEDRNENLYYNLNDCVNFCLEIPHKEYDNIDFHMFWNVGLPFERKQTLPIKSFLCTQNLNKTNLIVWSNVDLSNNEFLKPFLNYIKLKIWNPNEEAKNTPIEGKKKLLNTNDSLNYCAGDLFRILVLYKYGGVYSDFDMVFLRGFGPLLEQEFMYKWSFQKEMINGAIIRMFKESQLGLDLLNEMANGPVIPNSLNWSTDLYQKVRKYNKNWTIFPCGFFNTEWQIHLSDTEKKDSKFKTLYDFIRFPFKKNPLSGEMYNGVFSWHWHNGWNEKIEEGCKWELLESKFNKLTYEKFKIKNL